MHSAYRADTCCYAACAPSRCRPRRRTSRRIHRRVTEISPKDPMFTGLVETLGTVRSVVVDGPGTRLVVAAPQIAAELAAGDSVAVNGACLTVVDRDGESCHFQAGPE